MHATISIVTPSFNQARFLEQTIDSVLSQGYPNLQYIIIDGQSNDGSVEIIKKYEKYLSYWTSEPDRGQSHAINKGLQRVHGAVVNWLNSDDYLEPGSLNVIAERFSDPSVNVVIGRSHIVQDGKVIRLSSGTDVYAGNVAKTLGWARLDQPETYFRKRIFDQLGPLNECLHYVMDKEFWMRFLLKFGLDGIVKIRNVLTNFRLHSESKTVSRGQQFITETNYLYFQLAAKNGSSEQAYFIENNLSLPKNVTGPLFSDFTGKERLVEEAMDYFFLYKADEAYYHHDRRMCRLLLSALDRTRLADAEQKLHKKISFRSRFFPVFAAKMWRP